MNSHVPDSTGNAPKPPGPRLGRRAVLGLSGAAVATTAAGLVLPRWLEGSATAGHLVAPHDPVIAATERARARTGRVVRRTLNAGPATVDLGGREVSTWAFDGEVPGRPIRVKAGDQLQARVSNDLPESTSVHWHGLALRNDMDGVPGVTQPGIAPGARFDYSFVVPHPGTYWFHPHSGVQPDTGLYAPLIVEDPDEPGAYDEEIVLVLDDWTDDWGQSPDAILRGFRSNGMGMNMGMNMGEMASTMSSTENPLGTDTGDVSYPAHLVNGRLPTAPDTFRVEPGRRVRIRLINAGADTAYRFAVGGHRMSVTHSDGFPVVPVEVDALILGMGERFDVTVTVGDGVFALVAAPEGKDGPPARALLRSGAGAAPPPGDLPRELTGRLLAYTDLLAAEGAALGPAEPDRELDATLTMANGGRRWMINDRTFEDSEPLVIARGERVRVRLANKSMMFHPMHLHGHTFALTRKDGRGVRKDNLNVPPMSEPVIDFVADNPGRWVMHCHNIYHMELGMMTTFGYRAPASR